MSLIRKYKEYSTANGGKIPTPIETLKIAHKVLDEYMNKLAIAVIPDRDDAAVITAAFKLIYESRYNALEPYEKELCDNLVRTSIVVSQERFIDMDGENKKEV